MKLTTEKSRLAGEVIIPASKSHTIRAIAIASLADGKSKIHNPLISNDANSSVECFRALGAKIDTSNANLWIVTGTSGKIKSTKEIIDVGNSGTTLRLATGAASLAPKGHKVTFTGDEQTQNRPMASLLASLNDLGAKCRSIKNNGKAPIEIEGGLRGGKTTIECPTSQYLSSLLLCTPLAENDTEINVTLLNEPGYVDITLDWLNWQGIKYENKGMRKFLVKGGQHYKAFDLAVPADFSSATFFLCAASLFGEKVVIKGLDFKDSQPDKVVVTYLKKMGADIEVGVDAVTVKASRLHGIEIDMNATPDALPAMAVTAAFAEGATKLVNVSQARLKETDRIKCMAMELKKMGVDVRELPDGLIIKGGNCKPTDVHGWADHRIVMALSIAGMAMDGKMMVDTAEAMSVTFPDYVKLMKNLGANIQIGD